MNGEVICEIPRSCAKDIDMALDAAHQAKDAWAKTSVTERANLMLKIADRIEANLAMLAVAETWDNGKAVRETLAADLRCVSTTSVTTPAVSVRRKAPLEKLTSTPCLSLP